MTTRVYVVYVFGKHIHAFKLLIYSINRSVFRGRVYVWRLIPPKNTGSKLLIIYFPSNAKTQRRRVFSLFIYFLCGFAPLCLFLMKEKTIYFPESRHPYLPIALISCSQMLFIPLIDGWPFCFSMS